MDKAEITDLVCEIYQESDWAEQQVLLQKLYDQLDELAGVANAKPDQYYDESGLILSSRDASLCTLAPERTVKYWRALQRALEKLRQKRSDTLKVLYPGSGPFAILTLPVLLGLFDQNVHVTIVETNSDTVNCLRQLLNALGIGDDKVTLVEQDALKFQSQQEFDVLIMECLLPTLQYEGQVAITHHLTQFLASDGVLIPELIQVDLQWSDLVEELEFVAKNRDAGEGIAKNKLTQFRTPISTLLSLSRDCRNITMAEEGVLSLAKIKLSSHQPRRTSLIYCTTMVLLDDIRLDEYQNGLTTPQAASEIFSDVDSELQVNFRMYNRPEFETQVVEANAELADSLA